MEIMSEKYLEGYNVTKKICYFHYSQCLMNRRKGKNKVISGFVYGLKTLAIAPIDRVGDIYSYLYYKYYYCYQVEREEDIDEDSKEKIKEYFNIDISTDIKKYIKKSKNGIKEKSEELVRYFSEQYLNKLENLNVSQFSNRTNNYCESLNRDMKRFFSEQRIRNYRNNLELLGRMICRYI